MKSEIRKKTRYFLYLLWFGAFLVSIKSVFTDFGVDNSYAVAASYRHISGDRMFAEMWEPHQTSVFLTDILMLLYRFFVPSLTGVAIYLQIMGVLLWILVILILHKELSKHIDRGLSHLICIFLLVFRAKQTVFPEFSNMQIGFSILFFVFLVKFICDQAKLRYLILSAIFMCLEIISYPSCIIAYAAALGILIMYTEHRGRNALAFSGVCAASGALYVGYFIWARGPAELLDTLSLLIKADAHLSALMPLHTYFQVFAEGALYIAGVLAIAAVIRLLLRKQRDCPFLEVLGGVLLLTAGILLFILMIRKQFGYEWHYCIVLVLLIIVGILGYRQLTHMEKRIWVSGMLISFSSFFAVMVLTDCTFITVVAYLSLAAAVSMIPLSKLRGGAFFAGAVLMFVLLHRGLIMCGYSYLSYNVFVTQAESIVRTGPALGIIYDDVTNCIYRDNVADFQNFIEQGDSVFFLRNRGYDPMFYVQSGAGVSVSSTISSPRLGSYQVTYWEKYRYKTPSVIAVACYGGEIMVDPQKYPEIFAWVEEHYEWAGDGTWWRFYRIKE